MTAVLILEVAGTKLGLFETKVKAKDDPTDKRHLNADGTNRTYFVHRPFDKASAPMGVAYKPFASSVPDFVTIDGVKIELKHERKSEFTKDGKTVAIPADKQKDGYRGSVVAPFAGEERQASVLITKTLDGLWNVTATVTRVHGSSLSPEEKAAARQKAALTKADRNAAEAAAGLKAALAALGF